MLVFSLYKSSSFVYVKKTHYSYSLHSPLLRLQISYYSVTDKCKYVYKTCNVNSIKYYFKFTVREFLFVMFHVSINLY